MKNKLLARIAASAISVTMLGTVAFAADPITATDVTETVSEVGADISAVATKMEGAFTTPRTNQITIMAYLVPGDSTTWVAFDGDATKIIALDQITVGDTYKLPIDKSKLGEYAIAVMMGCSEGDVVQALIKKDASGEIVVLGDVTGDGFIDFEDSYVISLYEIGETQRILNEGYPQFWDENDETVALKVGDVTLDTFVDFEDSYVISLYEIGETQRIINEGYPQFWPDEE